MMRQLAEVKVAAAAAAAEVAAAVAEVAAAAAEAAEVDLLPDEASEHPNVVTLSSWRGGACAKPGKSWGAAAARRAQRCT